MARLSIRIARAVWRAIARRIGKRASKHRAGSVCEIRQRRARVAINDRLIQSPPTGSERSGTVSNRARKQAQEIARGGGIGGSCQTPTHRIVGWFREYSRCLAGRTRDLGFNEIAQGKFVQSATDPRHRMASTEITKATSLSSNLESAANFSDPQQLDCFEPS
jgi:hypothetical protein